MQRIVGRNPWSADYVCVRRKPNYVISARSELLDVMIVYRIYMNRGRRSSGTDDTLRRVVRCGVLSPCGVDRYPPGAAEQNGGG